MPPQKLSASATRRVALAAQGFAEPRPSGRVDRRHVRKLFDRIGLIQIDSVNVLVRSQELPVFARLGVHRRDLLSGMAFDGELFEYWGHAASLLPIEHFPLFRFHMDNGWGGEATRGLARIERERPGYVDAVLQEVAVCGPVTAAELSEGGKRKGSWWEWSDGKQALEYLFWSGQLMVRRRPNFEREYDLTERIIPPEILALPAPEEDDARRELVALAARSLGVATTKDLCDYYHLNLTKTRPRVAELVDEGRLVPVQVEGWSEVAYLDPAARVPRRLHARALLSPFDSVVWERARTERVFGFRYRLEIYTPAAKREFGYYVLPFLLGEDLVARVDLKADRQAGVLRVPGVYSELGVPDATVAHELAEELELMATWLGLERIEVADKGDLAEPLQATLSQRRPAPTG
jgi:uncharacterized protein YcaQ